MTANEQRKPCFVTHLVARSAKKAFSFSNNGSLEAKSVDALAKNVMVGSVMMTMMIEPNSKDEKTPN